MMNFAAQTVQGSRETPQAQDAAAPLKTSAMQRHLAEPTASFAASPEALRRWQTYCGARPALGIASPSLGKAHEAVNRVIQSRQDLPTAVFAEAARLGTLVGKFKDAETAARNVVFHLLGARTDADLATARDDGTMQTKFAAMDAGSQHDLVDALYLRAICAYEQQHDTQVWNFAKHLNALSSEVPHIDEAREIYALGMQQLVKHRRDPWTMLNELVEVNGTSDSLLELANKAPDYFLKLACARAMAEVGSQGEYDGEIEQLLQDAEKQADLEAEGADRGNHLVSVYKHHIEALRSTQDLSDTELDTLPGEWASTPWGHTLRARILIGSETETSALACKTLQDLLRVSGQDYIPGLVEAAKLVSHLAAQSTASVRPADRLIKLVDNALTGAIRSHGAADPLRHARASVRLMAHDQAHTQNTAQAKQAAQKHLDDVKGDLAACSDQSDSCLLELTAQVALRDGNFADAYRHAQDLSALALVKGFSSQSGLLLQTKCALLHLDSEREKKQENFALRPIAAQALEWANKLPMDPQTADVKARAHIASAELCLDSNIPDARQAAYSAATQILGDLVGVEPNVLGPTEVILAHRYLIYADALLGSGQLETAKKVLGAASNVRNVGFQRRRHLMYQQCESEAQANKDRIPFTQILEMGARTQRNHDAIVKAYRDLKVDWSYSGDPKALFIIAQSLMEKDQLIAAGHVLKAAARGANGALLEQIGESQKRVVAQQKTRWHTASESSFFQRTWGSYFVRPSDHVVEAYRAQPRRFLYGAVAAGAVSLGALAVVCPPLIIADGVLLLGTGAVTIYNAVK